MNSFYQFFTDLASAFDMVFEQWPLFFCLVPVVLMLNVLASLVRFLDLFAPACDPQDYDGDAPPGSARLNSPQYDPEHWYIGKD